MKDTMVQKATLYSDLVALVHGQKRTSSSSYHFAVSTVILRSFFLFFNLSENHAGEPLEKDT